MGAQRFRDEEGHSTWPPFHKGPPCCPVVLPLRICMSLKYVSIITKLTSAFLHLFRKPGDSRNGGHLCWSRTLRDLVSYPHFTDGKRLGSGKLSHLSKIRRAEDGSAGRSTPVWLGRPRSFLLPHALQEKLPGKDPLCSGAGLSECSLTAFQHSVFPRPLLTESAPRVNQNLYWV